MNDSLRPDPVPATPPWERFVEARTADAFCRAWLDLLCGQLPQVRAGAVLVQSADGQSFVPIAVWPSPPPDLSHLGGVVGRALGGRRAVVEAAAADAPQRGFQIAYPVLSGERPCAVVAIDTGCGPDQVQSTLREIHWGMAWLANLFGHRDWEEAGRGRERVGAVLEALAVALREGRFQQVLFDACNDLRGRLGASRVAIGLVRGGHVRVAALSEAATFEKHSPLVRAYARAMEEAMDAGRALRQSPAPAEAPASGPLYPGQLALLEETGSAQVLSLPLLQGVHCHGVITLERRDEAGFSDDDLAWLEAFAVLFAPVVAQRQAAERHSLARFGRELAALHERLFGPRHLVWKTVAAALVASALVLALVRPQYRVNARTVIEGEVQQAVAAPFEGFVGASLARAGDTVRRGQELARLDDRDLRLEQVRWTSQRDEYDNRLRDAMARHDLTAVQVTGAQLRQAEAQLALVTDKIARARLVAPYDGVVVSGDLSQKIGTPVEAGKQLFEVAPLQSYRVILQVDEREVRYLRAGQQGRLAITGMAGEPMPLQVLRVTPVAKAEEGGNFFRVEARLARTAPTLRPGMEGVAKVEVGRRSLWWILTHSLVDWLRLTLWNWLP